MKAGSKAIRILEPGLLLLGLLLLAMFAFAHIHRFIMFRAERAKFEARQLESAKGNAAGIEAIDGTSHNADLHRCGTLNARPGEISVLSCIRPISASLLDRLLS